MAIDNNISNPVAGWAWILAGFAAFAFWLGPEVREVNRDLGFFGAFRVERDSPDGRRLRRAQLHIFAYFAAWLALYLLLDWMF